MARINMGRVIGGGIVAGLVLNVTDWLINGVWLQQTWNTAMAHLNQAPMTGAETGWFIAMDFVVGILGMWLYAAIRPRFGPGPKTAICAALATWAMFAFAPAIGMWGMHLFPHRLQGITTALYIVQLVLAMLAGGKLYSEDAAAA